MTKQNPSTLSFRLWIAATALSLLFSQHASAFTATTSSSTPTFTALNDVQVTSLITGDPVNLGEYLRGNDKNSVACDKTLLILGTYAADFNAIEYAQRLRYYLPQLRDECGVDRFGMVLNCRSNAAKALAQAVDLNIDNDVDIFLDNTGNAGRAFGVGRGWLPDNKDISPFIKLFGMLWGLGAWATLPAVIGGYIGNPFVPQPWIDDALLVGQKQGRWPNNVLEINKKKNDKIINKFAELPLVGGWKRRPLELATLRLQSMIGISLARWQDLSPDQQALDAGVLTQLGGCVVVDNKTEKAILEWRDPGICAVANFEDIVKKLRSTASAPLSPQAIPKELESAEKAEDTPALVE